MALGLTVLLVLQYAHFEQGNDVLVLGQRLFVVDVHRAVTQIGEQRNLLVVLLALPVLGYDYRVVFAVLPSIAFRPSRHV